MPYRVIARRYRPTTFDEVVGQEAVAKTLKKAILGERIGHAYLFAGPRGVGKTSMARIFAGVLNCPQARDGDPCRQCEICRHIAAGDDIDVIELDGASHRGIDDVRGIIESAQFVPVRAPYKIFIIDEVHMLTREAFNALLKILEEPPPHVKFVFATTEPQRIPETIHSRCHRFDFRPICAADVVRRLQQVCDAEGVRAEEGVLERIARYTGGAMRDSQSLLDQLITFSQDSTLRVDDLDRIAGRLSEERIRSIAASIRGRDVTGVWDATRSALDEGTDASILIDQVLFQFRGELVTAIAHPKGKEPISVEDQLAFVQILHEALARMRSCPHPEVLAESVLLRLAMFADLRPLEDILSQLDRLASGQGVQGTGKGSPPGASGRPAGSRGPTGGAGPAPGEPRKAAEAPPATAPGEPRRAVEPPAPPPAEVNEEHPPEIGTDPQSPGETWTGEVERIWEKIVGTAGGRDRNLAMILEGLRVVRARGDEIVLGLAQGARFGAERLKGEDRRRAIEEFLGEALRRRVRVRFGWETDRGPGGANPAGHPMVLKAIEIFRGRPVPRPPSGYRPAPPG